VICIKSVHDGCMINFHNNLYVFLIYQLYVILMCNLICRFRLELIFTAFEVTIYLLSVWFSEVSMLWFLFFQRFDTVISSIIGVRRTLYTPMIKPVTISKRQKNKTTTWIFPKITQIINFQLMKALINS